MATQDGFTAIVLEESDGKVTASIDSLDDSALPDGDVTVAVDYSTLNYKDGMIINGLGRIVRNYPHVPGIDFAGSVIESASPKFRPGDQVVLNGYRVGELHWGGMATKARVQADWLVPLSDGMTSRRAMAIGTAGLTAMLGVMALENHGLVPGGEGEVLVTGAAGGVGSIAVAILANLGYRVAASTGRAETHDYLRDMGAATIIDRADLETPPKGPLGSARWAAAIDSVGGTTLATILATLAPWSSCAAIGLAAGHQLNTSVMPFLLRGLNLLGIDSNTCPMEPRVTAWRRLARELPTAKLEKMTAEVPLAAVPELAGKILQGQVKGRTVVDVNA
ncbi:MAG: MDR family oxidoreductase [Rhodospirillales bacterium]|jgi:acrylyl-CoA reductase (NADPH)|nr:MDR family oxidoreductase [Rhodospirillales bacterium]